MTQLNIFDKNTTDIIKPVISGHAPDNTDFVKIEESWKKILKDQFTQDYFVNLKTFLVDEKKKGNTIYPSGKNIFAAFNNTPFDKVKAVILGQDPYHGEGQAQGLCFSVPESIKPPPSLVNIFKELNNDLGTTLPTHGNLSSWALQGVLLLNATLTVQAHKPGSHQNKGWEQFTDEIIRQLSEKRKNLVFMLWGKYALDKGIVIDRTKHLVLTAPHPSPYSADRGFFGCKHFSKANQYLKNHEIPEIDWEL